MQGGNIPFQSFKCLSQMTITFWNGGTMKMAFFSFQRAFERPFSSFPVALPVSWWQQTSFPGNSHVRDRIKTPRGTAANSDHPGKSARTKSGSSLLQAPKQSLSLAFPAMRTQSLCGFVLHTIKLAGEEIQNGISLDYHSTGFTSGEGEGILPWVHPRSQS